MNAHPSVKKLKSNKRSREGRFNPATDPIDSTLDQPNLERGVNHPSLLRFNQLELFLAA